VLKILRAGALGPESAPADVTGWMLPADAVWVDLIQPTREEELLVEQALGVSVPTPEEMLELEPSSRLYQDDGSTFMTAMVLVRADAEFPEVKPITFILAGPRLVTVRYIEPRSFVLFTAQAARQPSLCPDGPRTFLGLLDAIVDRASQVLSTTATGVDQIARQVFSPRPGDFNRVLVDLGRAQTINADIRESLVSIARMSSYAGLATQISSNAQYTARLSEVTRDVQFLLDQASFESGNVSFVMEATLGFISNQQNNVIKFLTVAGAAFLPPTLIASVYGMNFEHIPELSWRYGYLWALGLMLASAALPLLWFRRMGWL
jgi:magnesium transporter